MSDQTHHSGADGAFTLARRLKSIRDPRMRCVVLAEFLRTTAAETAVEVLAAVIARATAQGQPDALAAAECIGATLGDPELVPYGARSDLYAAAKHSGRDEIARLFFDASPSLPSSADQVADPFAPERRVVPRGRTITLGERKSLARSHRRELLEHLLRDPHPEVVKILLGNPHLTETEVVIMAARRPAVPEALAAIARHPRWGTRYHIKRALAYNPYTPVHLSIRLITTLRARDLRGIAHDGHLPAPLREQARDLLGQR